MIQCKVWVCPLLPRTNGWILIIIKSGESRPGWIQFMGLYLLWSDTERSKPAGAPPRQHQSPWMSSGAPPRRAPKPRPSPLKGEPGLVDISRGPSARWRWGPGPAPLRWSAPRGRRPPPGSWRPSESRWSWSVRGRRPHPATRRAPRRPHAGWRWSPAPRPHAPPPGGTQHTGGPGSVMYWILSITSLLINLLISGFG